MIAQGTPPTKETCNALLTVLSHDSSAMRTASQFAEKYFFSTAYPIEPNLRTFEHLIRGYGLAGDRDGSWSVALPVAFCLIFYGPLLLTL